MLPTSVKYPSELQKERKRNRRNSSEDFKNLEGENGEITATFSQLEAGEKGQGNGLIVS